jgi:hypothetical protein
MKRAAIAVLAVGILAFSACEKDEEQTRQPADSIPQQPAPEPVQQDTSPPTGEPRFVITIEEDSLKSKTGQACVAGNRVDVHAEIGGGARGNSLWGVAHCGDAIVAKTATILDPGNGQAVRAQKQGTQVDGQSSCSKNMVGQNPKSRVTVVCYFY